MTATFTEVLPKTASTKGNAINWTPSANGSGLLTIHAGCKSTDYRLTPLATTWGRGFTLAKLDGSERYCVLVGKPGEASRCDCPAGCYRESSRIPCKHIAAALALIENEVLWGTEPAEVPAPTAPVAKTPYVSPDPRADADFF